MAQLDIISYFTQIFWLTVILSTFYVVLIRKVLPEIKKTFKIRALTIALEGSAAGESSGLLASKEENKLITHSLSLLNKEVKEIDHLNTKLIVENVKGKNRRKVSHGLNESNQTYINSVTKLVMQRNV
jgi:F0F1-type ATP synthase membrane subunit b/b'